MNEVCARIVVSVFFLGLVVTAAGLLWLFSGDSDPSWPLVTTAGIVMVIGPLAVAGFAKLREPKPPAHVPSDQTHFAATRGASASTRHGAAGGGRADTNTSGAAGIPTLDGLGPLGAGAHVPDERIEIASLAARAALLASVLTLTREWIREL